MTARVKSRCNLFSTSSSAEKAITSITITLSDEQSQRVQRIADELGISLEELVRVGPEDLLTHPNAEFLQVANYVMEKNAEPYRRLV